MGKPESRDSWLASLREDHRDAGRRILDAILSPDREGVVVVLDRGSIGSYGSGSRITLRLTGISMAVVDVLWWDARNLRDGLRPHYYTDHQRRQERIQAKRREALARRKRDPQLHRPYDSQRSRLYKAEGVISTQGQRFTTVEEMQAYVDKLTASAWWKRRFFRRRIHVRPGLGHRRATGSSFGVVQMPVWARCEAVLLHEVAHVVTLDAQGMSAPYHGREFARVFLDLVRHQLGEESWRVLRDSFKVNRVKHTKPRVPMSAERREEAGVRLAAARAAKSAKDS